LRKLLDASSQRMIKILEILLSHQGWTTLSYLSGAIKSSERTVASDISELKKNWGDKLNLEISKKSGVRLHNQNIASISLVFKDLFNDSVALHWLRELLFHPNHSIEFYENRLYVSRSTLMRLLPKINRFLHSRGMSIEHNYNRFELLGKDEQYLRDFSASFLLELYGLDPNQFDVPVNLGIIHELILTLAKKSMDEKQFLWFMKDDIAVIYQMMLYLVSLLREHQGYELSCAFPIESDFYSKYFSQLKEYFPNIEKKNLQPLHYYLHQLFNGWDTNAEKELITKESDIYLENISAVASIAPDEDTKHLLRFAIQSVYLNAKLRPISTSVLFDRILYFSRSLKQANPRLYQVAYEGLKNMSTRIDIDMSVRISDVLFWMCLTCPELCRTSHRKTALLIVDFGSPHAQFIASLISDFCNKSNIDNLEIEIATVLTLAGTTNLDNYDMMITTIPNLPVLHPHTVLINDYPSSHNLFEIYSILQQ
jgi:hypothetical protein